MLNPETVAQLAALASRGPRYTSYPPATEFRPIDPGCVQRELERVGDLGESISLYVHIPFCRSLCWYCGCNVIPARDASRGVAYLDRLALEIDRVETAVRSAPVTEIALGGGSPNFLSPQSLRQLFEQLDARFAVAPDARRSIELDPRSTTSAQIDALAAARFKSLSMGVQDFSEAVQDAIHRHQTVRQTRWLVDRARGAGFDDVNVDVVYGLPHQTELSFTRTLDAVIGLLPDRIALFRHRRWRPGHPRHDPPQSQVLARLQPRRRRARRHRPDPPPDRRRGHAAQLAHRPRELAALESVPVMTILYLILPLALLLAAGAVAAFAWTVRSGQLDDVDTPPRRILFDDEPALPRRAADRCRTRS